MDSFNPTRTVYAGISDLEQTRRFSRGTTEEFLWYRNQLEDVISRAGAYPDDSFEGRGIVTVAGGTKYFPPAWVLIRMLRQFGCDLPVEVAHIGPEELNPAMRAALAEDGNIRPVDIRAVSEFAGYGKNIGGWPAKILAIISSRFREVLFLDSDNVPVRNPEYLFWDPAYLHTGAVFWPDYRRLERNRTIWNITGVPYRDEPEFESGQIVVDKARCWTPLQATLHMNLHAGFYYKHIWGDKDTFHMAWRKCGRPYSMPRYPIHKLTATRKPGDVNSVVMCQHDLQGNRLFQHRNIAKWSLYGQNPRIPDFWYEEECLQALYSFNRFACGTALISGEVVDEYDQYRKLQGTIPHTRGHRLHFLSGRRVDGKLQLFPDHRVVSEDFPDITQWHLVREGKQVRLVLYTYLGLPLVMDQKTLESWEGFLEPEQTVFKLRAL